MKYCPVCQQGYDDETLNFCLEDGSHLVSEDFISNSPTLVHMPSISSLISGGISGRISFGKIPSIAILPFINVSSDPDNEYFCLGLAEELINALMKLDKLRVAARTSTFAYKGRETDVRQIGQALNVNTVLEGSVRKSENRLRINVQLINVADGYHLWSERFDRQLEDVFEIQEEIALAVVDALKVRLLGDERAVLRKRYTDNPEAYEYYLKGRLWNRRTVDGFKTAISYFHKAIELDNDYAVAYSGLTDYHLLLGFYEILPPAIAGEKAKGFARKAVELDDTLAETHSSYGATLGGFDWNWSQARDEYEKALEINPNYLAAQQYYAINLAMQGDFDGAFERARRCLEIEPLLPIINANLAWFYYLSRQYESAEEQARLTIDIEPSHFSAYWVLGVTYGKLKRFDEALSILQKAADLSNSRPFVLADMARLLGETKKKSEAKKILKKIDEAARSNYISATNRAKIYVGLGEPDKVFEHLEKAVEERAVRLPGLLLDPLFDGVREDKRFAGIERKVGMNF